MSSVDVVIPVYQPDDKLKMIVSRLMGQTVRPNNIFLIHTMCEKTEAQTRRLLKDLMDNYEEVHVLDIREDEFDHGGTRAKAMEMCQSDYVLMMTMDAVPKNPKLIATLLKAHGEKIAVVYAKQEPEKNCRTIERFTRSFNYPDEPSSGIETAARTNNGIKAIFCSDVCAMYERNAYEEVGGFPAKAIFNEDEIFAAKALKAGYDVCYEPDAVVIHSHNYNGIQYFRRYFDMGVSQADFRYVFDEYHAEDEGVRLVKNTFDYLMKRECYWEIPILIYHSGMKYLGLQLGKRYKKLPKELVLKLTSNKNYWKA